MPHHSLYTFSLQHVETEHFAHDDLEDDGLSSAVEHRPLLGWSTLSAAPEAQ